MSECSHEPSGWKVERRRSGRDEPESAHVLCHVAHIVTARKREACCRVVARNGSCIGDGVFHWILASVIRHRLPARGLLVPIAALSGATLLPGRVDACGARPDPSYTITGVTPVGEASDVPRDTGILISSTSCSGRSAVSAITLIDADTGEASPVLVIAWSSALPAEDLLAFHPVAPLAPQHRYRIEATHRDSPAAPDEQDEEIDVSAFTTSDALLEPLVLAGELQLSLRGTAVYSPAINTCPITAANGAASDCYIPPEFVRRALVVDVTLPAASGGQGLYRGMLYFSDGAPTSLSDTDPAHYQINYADPNNFQGGLAANPVPGETLTLPRELDDEGFAYAPCFEFVVWDPAGHVAQASTCLPSLSPDDMQALASKEEVLSLSPDPQVASDELRRALGHEPGAAPSPSCSIARRPATRTPVWPMLLLTSLGLRRRARSATPTQTW